MQLADLRECALTQGINIYEMAWWQAGQTERAQVMPAREVGNIYSISKNFTATAVGMLIDEGRLSLCDSIYELFADKVPDMSERWRAVQVRHVLSQTTGIEEAFLDVDCEDARTYGTTDYLSFVLHHAPVHAPGSVMLYSDSNFYLASRVVERVCGEKLQSFLQKRLFLPLEFQSWAWAVCPEGSAMGATGLFLRVRDLVLLGALYACGGELNGHRFFSQTWAREAVTPVISHQPGHSYALSFWVEDGYQAFHMGGMLGQKVFVSPGKQIAVAWEAYDPENRGGALLQMLYEADRDGTLGNGK